MSLLDRIANKVMPPESEEDRANARRVAESLTSGDDWLAMVLDHHRQIEALFAEAGSAAEPGARQAAFKRLAVFLTGHANAEESVLYPALSDDESKSHAAMAYEEQAMTKVQMGLLETIDPMSQEWAEKLDHIRGAVLHHIYSEEGTWFPALQQRVPSGDRGRLTMRFREEFERYCGASASQAPMMQMAAQENRGSQHLPPNMGAADY